jgi:inosine/xanthosine triphosphatase
MRKIAVGTTNPVKIGAVENVVARIWPGAEVVGVPVPSGISAQPMTEEETRRGAANRALAARVAVDADLGLGLEGGLDSLRGRWYLVNSVAAIDRHGQRGEGGGVRMEIPPSFIENLRAGQELGDVVDAASGQVNTKQKEGAIGLLTAGLADRRQSFEQAATYALVRWLAPSLYPAPPVVTFRPSTPDDLPMILAAEQRGCEEGFIGMDTAETHRQWMSDPDVEHRVIVRDGSAVGYLILRGLSGRDDAIEVKRICLTQRGAGTGSAVFAALLPWAFEDRGAHRVWLDVYVENTRARRLYERAGFREEGRLRECERGPNGFRTLILMSILRDEWIDLVQKTD